jgi:MGT family glycosyltransferase
MSHVVFVGPPTVGHINPTLPVVEELVARQHRVSYVTGPRTTDAAERSGAHAIELPLVVHDETEPGAGFSAAALATTLNRLVDDVRDVAPTLVDILRDDPPDIVCHDALSFIGPCLAAMFQVPEVRLTPHLADNEHFSVAVAMAEHGFDPRHPAMAFFAHNVAKLVEELWPAGIAPADTPPSLVFIPKRFQIAGETFGDDVRFVGPSLPSGAGGDLTWQPRYEGTSPLVYIALGTIMHNRPEFFSLCIDTFAGSEWQVAMAVGDHVHRKAFDDAPPNFDIRPFFPQRTVLKYAQAFVSHAGMNSVMEAVRERVPIIGVPQTAEGAVNAQRVEELSLGCVLKMAELTPDGLLKTVRRTARDLHVRHGLSVMAQELVAGGGAAAGADVIEDQILGRFGSVNPASDD